MSGWQIVAVVGVLCVTFTICLGMWLAFKAPIETEGPDDRAPVPDAAHQ